jgi:hypothetical protein
MRYQDARERILVDLLFEPFERLLSLDGPTWNSDSNLRSFSLFFPETCRLENCVGTSPVAWLWMVEWCPTAFEVRARIPMHSSRAPFLRLSHRVHPNLFRRNRRCPSCHQRFDKRQPKLQAACYQCCPPRRIRYYSGDCQCQDRRWRDEFRSDSYSGLQGPDPDFDSPRRSQESWFVSTEVRDCRPRPRYRHSEIRLDLRSAVA